MVLAACAPAPAPPGLDAIASRYIELASELARHDPSLVDHWLTAPPLDGGTRRPVSTSALALEQLVDEAETAAFETSGDTRARAEWLRGQVRALRLAARRLMGESFPFDTEARLAFDHTPARADLFATDRAREALDAALPGREPLGTRIGAFKARFAVPAARRDAVMRAALDACREATRTGLPLPADEGIELRFVDALPWDAHAQYLGSHRTRLDVNASATLDLTRALRLACHEGYAGHHVQHITTADELVARRGWFERALVPGFGPELLMAEGRADAGAALAFPPDRRAAAYRERLAPLAGLADIPAADFDTLVAVEDAQTTLESLITDIARDYLDNRTNGERTVERLEQDVLMPGAEAFVSFIERRRTRILAYTEGRRLAEQQIGPAGLSGLRRLLAAP